MDVWKTIPLAIGGNTALVAVLAYFAKSLIGGWIDKEQLEALKAAHSHFDRKHRDARNKLERDLRAIMGDVPHAGS